ncbi:hypothetical protein METBISCDRAFT_23799 [Metschnikowia bicuspidata]|uniref:Zn(2)-C6 fungal-type domain-containing protein n=1 Tax=Metschnikowia bicuspidata TaxID=27322 RepID=A0A4P9ZC23_9ASCO|nr:hypothetical protein METBISCDRAFT_23799 [Metschnikowia bicuspidata]
MNLPQSPQTRKATRRRRCYACGPCHKLKLKCNLRVPCGSCTSLGRPEKCLESPPNPPTEQEKIVIERRKRMLRGRPRPANTPRSDGTDKPDVDSNGDCKSDSPGRSRWGDAGHMASSCPTLRRRRPFFDNIQDYAVLRNERRRAGDSVHTLPVSLSSMAQRLVLNMAPDALSDIFAEYSLRDVSGVADVVSLEDMYCAFDAFASCYARCTVDRRLHLKRDLLEQLSLGALVVSQKLILDHDTAAGEEWLEFSVALRSLVPDPTDIVSTIAYGVWVLVAKTPYFMLGQVHRIANLFGLFYAHVAQAPDIVRYFQMSPLLETNQLHKSAARTWVLIKITELEVSLLGANGSLQHKFPALNDTFQPDYVLLNVLFATHSERPGPCHSRFHLMLYQCSRYFGRFQHAQTSRQLILAYLLLHQEFTTAMLRISQLLTFLMRCRNSETFLGSQAGTELELPSQVYHMAPGFPDPANPIVSIPIGLATRFGPAPEIDPANDSSRKDLVPTHSTEFCDLMLNLAMLRFFFTRLLIFIKLERSYFPSLRFTHYVTNLMCMFNRVFHLAETRGLLVAEFETLFRKAYFADILLQYLCCGFQAIFLCVFMNFADDRSFELTVDPSFLVSCISKSLHLALSALRQLPVTRISIIAGVVDFVDNLCAYTASNARESCFDEFYAGLEKHILPANQTILFEIFFGSPQMCKTHLSLLWFLGQHVITNGARPIPITRTLHIDTAFFKQYEHLLEPFGISEAIVAAYMEDVVPLTLE